MKIVKKVAAVAALAMVPAFTVAPSAMAQQAPAASESAAAGNGASIQIIGGERAAQTPWLVQLISQKGGQSSGCTGQQINARWVLTARHCIDGISSMNVHHSNSTSNRGPATRAASWQAAPSGDIALVRLANPVNLANYPQLNYNFTPQNSGSGVIAGYGLRANNQPSDGLYQATVDLTGRSLDAYRGTAQHINGRSGAANRGDSGGPLLVNNQVVAVCSTGDSANPGANRNSGSNYSTISQSASWIRSTSAQ